MTAEPFVYFSETSGLPEEQELLRLHIRPRLQPVEIHAAREIAPVEADFMIADLLFPIRKSSHKLAESVVDFQGHLGFLRQTIAYCRGRVEWVGETLIQHEFDWMRSYVTLSHIDGHKAIDRNGVKSRDTC